MAKKIKKKEPTLSEVMEAIKGLNERIGILEKPPEKKEEPKIPEEKFPVPMEYREITNTILNAKFGISIEAAGSGRPEFHFTINVPREYSNMTDSEWDFRKADMRSKVISYAEGINGVREWCERVFKNLGPDIQAMITADRVKLVGEK